MFTLILLVILALVFSFFATANTQIITINLAGNTISLPLYIAIGATLLIGLSLSWVISLVDSFTSAMKISGKEHDIKDAKTRINELTRKVNDLEIENAKLAERTKRNPDPDSM